MPKQTFFKNSFDLHLTNIADHIRSKFSVSEPLSFPQGFIDAMDTYEPAGNISVDDIAGRTFPSMVSGNASVILTYGFYNSNTITDAAFPNCIRISEQAFELCIALRTLSFPLCQTIGSSAFYGCRSIESIIFPACISIFDYVFDQCSRISSIYFPACQYIGIQAFVGCTAISEAIFPECTVIKAGAFANCSFSTASFPKCERIESYAFQRTGDTLRSVYLLGSVVPSLSINAFGQSPLYGRPGTIYVRPDMYAAFAANRYWSSYASILSSYYGG